MMVGKTKLGKRISRLSKRQFIDTDKVIIDRHGRIADIFEQRGEPFLRDVEHEAVQWALEQPDAVVALGGGAPMTPKNHSLLANEYTVLLTMTPEAAKRRLALTHERPLLKHGGIQAWTEIYEKRLPTYRSLARIEFDTSAARMEQIARSIFEWREDQ